MTDRRIPAAPKGALAAAMRRIVGKEEEAPAPADVKRQPAAGSLASRMRVMIGKET